MATKKTERKTSTHDAMHTAVAAYPYLEVAELIMHPPHSEDSVSPLGLFVIEAYSKRLILQTGAPRQTGFKHETKTDLTETSMCIPVPR